MAKKLTPELKDKLRKYMRGELGEHELSASEKEEFESITGDIFKLIDLKDEFGLETSQDALQMLGGVIQTASNGTSYLDQLRGKIKRGEVTERTSATLNTIVNLAQIGTAASQIGRSNRQLGELRRPSMPTPPGEDPALSQAIYQAQQGTFDPSRSVQAAENKILNQRRAADEAVRQVSRGQGAQYQAGRQANALAAMGAMGELAPLIDSIRAREAARLDSLIEQRQRNRMFDFRNRMNMYELANENYETDFNAAAGLGAIGRQNMFTGLGSLANNMAVGAGYGMPQMRVPNFKNPFRTNKTGDPYIDGLVEDSTGKLSLAVSDYRINPYDVAPMQSMYNTAANNVSRRITGMTTPGISASPGVNPMGNPNSSEFFEAYQGVTNPIEVQRRSAQRITGRY